MNPLIELQKMLNPKRLMQKEVGTVVHVTDTLVHVLVNRKQRILQRNGGRYAVGEEVTVQGETLLGRKRSSSTVNQYSV